MSSVLDKLGKIAGGLWPTIKPQIAEQVNVSADEDKTEFNGPINIGNLTINLTLTHVAAEKLLKSDT